MFKKALYDNCSAPQTACEIPQPVLSCICNDHFFLFLSTACSKEGPQRPAGPQDEQGVAGPQGTNGDIGATGATGAKGATGTANVIYSDWLGAHFASIPIYYKAMPRR